MRGYKLTGRGWALAVVVAALLFVGTYALVSSVFGGEPPDSPPSGPNLGDVSPSSGDPSPSPSPSPDPSPVPSPSPDPSPESSPDDGEPSPEPTPPKPSPSPSPKPPEPSPAPDPSPVLPASSPDPLPSTPDWADNRASVMFDFDSAEPANLSLALSDLADLLPPLDEMSGYVVVVTAYTASDETTEDLARLRAEAVYDMLHSELGLPAEAIRLYSDPVSVDTQRYRQRADIYFLYVGNK